MGAKTKIWKIAVCDDETVFLDKIQQLTTDYYMDRDMTVEVHCYENAESFLQSD